MTAVYKSGVALESVEFAGHQQLDNLILIYDSNAVTLDAMAKESQSSDTAKHFESIGFDVQTVDGHELDAVFAALERAKKSGSGKPQLIIAKTLIGKGIPEVQGTQKAHGEGGAKFIEAARKGLGLPAETFYVAPEVTAFFAEHEKKLAATYDAWQKTFEAWKAKNPKKLAEELGSSRAHAHTVPADTAKRTPSAPGFSPPSEVAAGTKIATRKGRARRAAAALARKGAAPQSAAPRGSLRLDPELHR